MNPELISSIDFSVDEVHKELLSLQKDKACGPECISAHLLQVGADFLAAPLSKLFKLSLSTGTLPRDRVTQLTLYQSIKRVTAFIIKLSPN